MNEDSQMFTDPKYFQKQCTFMHTTEQTCQGIEEVRTPGFFFDRCEDLGLSELKPGTTRFDVECGKQIQVAVIVAVIGSIVVVAGALLIALIVRYKTGRYSGKCLTLL